MPFPKAPKRLKPSDSGEWIQPRMKNYFLSCCDCGLMHRLNFRIHEGRIQFQAFRARDGKMAK
jgi:hypothetical protein